VAWPGGLPARRREGQSPRGTAGHCSMITAGRGVIPAASASRTPPRRRPGVADAAHRPGRHLVRALCVLVLKKTDVGANQHRVHRSTARPYRIHSVVVVICRPPLHAGPTAQPTSGVLVAVVDGTRNAKRPVAASAVGPTGCARSRWRVSRPAQVAAPSRRSTRRPPAGRQHQPDRQRR